MAIKLTRFQRDTLKEVGSIGAGSASNALSKLTGKLILVEMTKLNSMSVNEAYNLFGKSKSIVSVLFGISGDIDGAILTLSTKQTTLSISDMVKDNKAETAKELDNFTRDMIKEIANILVGSYLTALSDLSKMNMLESTPAMIEGDLKKIFNRAIRTFDHRIKEVIIVETQLIIGKKRFKEEIVLMLRSEIIDLLFDKLFKRLR